MSDAWDEFDEEAEQARWRERVARMLTLPPRCLDAFVVERINPPVLPGAAFDGHGEDNSLFAVNCPCGGGEFEVLGHPRPIQWGGKQETFFGGPLSLRCAACGRAGEIFDPRRDGFDAEQDTRSGAMRIEEDVKPAGPQKGYRCVPCDAATMLIWTRFEHSYEVCNDSTTDLYGEREQDFFSWFTLVGRCVACGTTQTVTEFETA